MNKIEYLFTCIAEEASEVAKEASKCSRFTPHHTWSPEHGSNVTRLDREFRELITLIYMISAEINYDFNFSFDHEKLKRTNHYMQISKELGALDNDCAVEGHRLD